MYQPSIFNVGALPLQLSPLTLIVGSFAGSHVGVVSALPLYSTRIVIPGVSNTSM